MAYYTVKALICICICMYCICVGEDTNEWAGYKGRYGYEPESFEIIIPKKVSHNGEFVSNLIPHHYKLSYYADRKRSELGREDMVHYLVPISGETHHLELHPNHGLLSKGAVIETRQSDGDSVVTGEAALRKVRDVQCHYSGRIRNQPGSKVALSTCFGLTGYIRTDNTYYFIEPVAGHTALNDEEQPHLIYQQQTNGIEKRSPSKCQTMNCDSASTYDISNNNTICKSSKPTPKPAKNKTGSIEIYTKINYVPSMNYKTSPPVLSINDLNLELLIVMDKSFMEFHKDYDVENYLITCLNIAFDLFHDASLERNLNLVVVRIIRMQINEPDLHIDRNGKLQCSLDRFRQWQNKVNPGDDTHPNHHDLAILLTRLDICENDRLCGMMGMTRLASVCDPANQAIICQDTGLVLGFTIAHEIGHALGMIHDSPTESGCNESLNHLIDYVMTSHINMKIGQWSSCSAKNFKMFLESGYGKCLLDAPTEHPFEYWDMFPGVIYNIDYQCQFLFGPEAAACDTGVRCDMMQCQLPKRGCINVYQMPATGTKCGEDKWCYRSSCLQLGERPGAVDGGWGPWSEWTSCTRTCGAGVMSRERICDSPVPSGGGKFCKGNNKEHMICNTEPCLPTGFSFRDLQCEQFNKWIYPEDGNAHEWEAYNLPHENPCALFCINEKKAVAVLSPRVIDGTSCLRGMRDICISGHCVNVPCDMILESKSKEDICGICHGDGTTCSLKEGVKSLLIRDPKAKIHDIMKVLDIPPRTHNIKIEEMEPTRSRIQVRDSTGKEVLIKGYELGMFNVFGSATWLGNIRKNQESLVIPGPISKGISIWMIILENTTVKYSIATEIEKRVGHYEWDFVEWTKCSAVCGPGIETAEASCIEKEAGAVDDIYCKTSKPEKKTRPCEVVACMPRWMVNDWSPCRCKKHTRERIVRCMRPSGEAEWIMDMLPDIECGKYKPREKEKCICSITDDQKRDISNKNKILRRSKLAARTDKEKKNDTSLKIRRKCNITLNELEKPFNPEVYQFNQQIHRYIIDKMDPARIKITVKANATAGESFPPRFNSSKSFIDIEGQQALELLNDFQQDRKKIKGDKKVRKRKLQLRR